VMTVGRDFYVEQAMLEAERIDREHMQKIIEALEECNDSRRMDKKI